MKRKIFCTIPQDQIKEPLTFTLGKKFQVEYNIRGASVTEEIALLSLELEGPEDAVRDAIQFLKDRGVQVEDLTEPEED